MWTVVTQRVGHRIGWQRSWTVSWVLCGWLDPHHPHRIRPLCGWVRKNLQVFISVCTYMCAELVWIETLNVLCHMSTLSVLVFLTVHPCSSPPPYCFYKVICRNGTALYHETKTLCTVKVWCIWMCVRVSKYGCKSQYDSEESCCVVTLRPWRVCALGSIEGSWPDFFIKP